MIRLPCVILVALLLTSCDPASRELVLVRPDGHVDQKIAADLVGLLDDESRLSVTLTDVAMTGGDALAAVAEGRADIALISNDHPVVRNRAAYRAFYRFRSVDDGTAPAGRYSLCGATRLCVAATVRALGLGNGFW